jgi:iron(III) transport system ATP-binding protein
MSSNNGYLWRLEAVLLKGEKSHRLNNIELTIRKGVTAVLGPSGSGKTSLLNLLVGFEHPDIGFVTEGLAPTNGALPIYWVPQDGGLWPHLTAREHLELVAGDRLSEGEMRGWLALFDIEGKERSRPAELSMGERARLSVARALASGAKALVMDEPFAHVDEARTGKYWQAIREWLAKTGASLVFSTHSPKMVLSEAQRVICVRDGLLLYEGGVEELYRRPATQAIAECLGEANWLSPDEARLWLGEEIPAAQCYRPEQIQIIPAMDGPAVVRRSCFMGSVAEVDLARAESADTRRFYHRPAGDSFRAGDRVVVRRQETGHA